MREKAIYHFTDAKHFLATSQNSESLKLKKKNEY